MPVPPLHLFLLRINGRRRCFRVKGCPGWPGNTYRLCLVRCTCFHRWRRRGWRRRGQQHFCGRGWRRWRHRFILLGKYRRTEQQYRCSGHYCFHTTVSLTDARGRSFHKKIPRKTGGAEVGFGKQLIKFPALVNLQMTTGISPTLHQLRHFFRGVCRLSQVTVRKSGLYRPK